MTSENGKPFAISPNQARAARALLGLTREQVATRSGIPMRTLSRFEEAEGVSRSTTIAAIRAALEGAGVEFIEENGGGPGVRLRKAGQASSVAEPPG